MGGPTYDRDVYSSSSTSNWGSSYVSSTKLSNNTLDSSMNPVGKILKSNSKHPIIIMLDVTGSNTNFAKVVYDKLPMFYGQIEEKNYLDDFEISICAVGDAYTDNYPLQVGDFAKGLELDSWIEKLVLEGGGGGQEKESYELAAYYLLNNTEFIDGAKPMVFFIGDEAPYPEVNERHANDYGVQTTKALSLFKETQTLDVEVNKRNVKNNKLKTTEVFEKLREKFNDNVFMFLNRYCGREYDLEITQSWVDCLAPERTIKFKEKGDEKSIVDMMLGTIAMISKTRTLDKYVVDMLGRGQTQQRIDNVKGSLGNLEKSLVPVVKTSGIIPTKSDVKKSEGRSLRL